MTVLGKSGHMPSLHYIDHQDWHQGRQFGTPLKFSSLEPLRGAPACAWMAPYSACWFIFFLFFFLSLFFLSFSSPFPSFFFFFWRPISDPGGRGPNAPPGYAPGQWRSPGQQVPQHQGLHTLPMFRNFETKIYVGTSASINILMVAISFIFQIINIEFV